MNYAEIKKTDVANGPGVRVSLFVSGCTHCCEDCFQPETWDFSYGKEFDGQTAQTVIAALRPSFIEGLTLLGGEPMEPDNQRALLPLVKEIRQILPEKTIWCFTGYLWEGLIGQSGDDCRGRCEVTDELLSCLDVLVDGEFQKEKKNISLQFRGSENQRLIDIKASAKAGEAVWWTEEHARQTAP